MLVLHVPCFSVSPFSTAPKVEIINPTLDKSTMPRLSNKEFLSKLQENLIENGGSSSVYLTQKRLVASLESCPKDQLTDLSSNVVQHPEEYGKNTRQYPVLIRYTNGTKESKISTVIDPENLDSFWGDYSTVLKTGFTGLRKKDKKKKQKVTKA